MTRQPLRIEMVLPTLVAAGMETIVARLTRRLAQRGHEVSVTCILSDGAVADALRAEGHRVTVVPTPGVRSNLHPTRLADWFRQVRPSVVHVHSGAWLKAARAAHLAGVPHTVHTVHGIEGNEPWFTRTLWQLAARYTDVIVSVSEPLLPYLARDMRLPREKLRFIPNGVDTDAFRPGMRRAGLRPTLGLDANEILVGNVARLTNVKNHALLLDAFAIVRRRVPEASLAIVGDGPLRADLQQRILSLALGSRAFLAGPLADMPEVYRDFDLFVLSSRFEGTSLSILEAMASGVCVVATAVGGNPDLLDHGRCGVLVAPDDPGALASAMIDLVRDPDRRRALAAGARARVIRNFGEAVMVQRYEDLYYDLPARRPSTVEASRGNRMCAE